MPVTDLLGQLEFFRDIGISEIDISPETEAIFPAQVSGDRVAKPRKGMMTLDNVREELGDCQRCKLAATRTRLVFGAGNPDADLMFVGEAPGFEEDRQGLPFVGRAGELLTKIIESIDLKRDDVYICNVLKCRPPGNRNPEPEEVETCSPFLRRQIEVIRPKLVCCMGAFAAQTMLRTKVPISKLRGQFHDIDGVRYIATFHPAYLLRNPEKKREVWEDMKLIRAELLGSETD